MVKVYDRFGAGSSGRLKDDRLAFEPDIDPLRALKGPSDKNKKRLERKLPNFPIRVVITPRSRVLRLQPL